jgi:hypothetical protein
MLKPHEKRKQGSAKERAADQIWTWNLERASPATPVQDPVATWRSQHRSNQAADATAEVRCDGRKRGRPLASEFRLAETAKIGWLGSASAASVAPRTHGCGALTSVKKAQFLSSHFSAFAETVHALLHSKSAGPRLV